MAINKVITKPPKIHAGLKNCLTYVLRSDKTEQTLTSITGPYKHKLEREIENVRVRNVKLNYLVNMSNVAAVETMRVERDDALLQAEEERQMALAMKEYCKNEVAKANKKANKRILEIKNKKEFWQIISITSLCVGVLIGQMI